MVWGCFSKREDGVGGLGIGVSMIREKNGGRLVMVLIISDNEGLVRIWVYEFFKRMVAMDGGERGMVGRWLGKEEGSDRVIGR
ncbi:unnamed protein product [Dovyalis caffra]|uniref:Uncharacterized protein n=1 Tax=Dovyalis caffra TaxID=77055 RepID=A0AAV1R749_9ROSI|nr:unnamed protein product [Dovyalis caffra]